jgi:signal transduction histidine kinase
VVNALLSRHHFILLGLRGQAKTRLLRSLTDLLDPEVPIIAGAELPDDPLAPVTVEGKALVAEADHRHAARFTFRCDARDLGTLSPDATECLYRIAQESLSNAARHAEARTVSVTLARTPDAYARLRVEDDGRGFDDAQAVRDDAFGVLGMRERAVALGGTLVIEGRPGEGTRVEVTVPLAG